MGQKPNSEPIPIGKFALAIIAYPLPDGKITFQIRSQSENIPDEVVITQVRAWLRSVEGKYFQNFSKNMQFRDDQDSGT